MSSRKVNPCHNTPAGEPHLSLVVRECNAEDGDEVDHAKDNLDPERRDFGHRPDGAVPDPHDVRFDLVAHGGRGHQ